MYPTTILHENVFFLKRKGHLLSTNSIYQIQDILVNILYKSTDIIEHINDIPTFVFLFIFH